MRASVRLVGRVRVVLALVVAALACAGAASNVLAGTRAEAPGWTPVTIPASDATPLACAFIIPSGSVPGGWPGVILFHGLGQSRADMEQIGTAFAAFGFAALACDARGTGASGGKFGLDGPRDVQDARDLLDWFAARSDVSNTQIGAFGLSLGGGEVWNAAVAGVPFKAIVPAIAWTSLGPALNPSGVPKGGEIVRLAQIVPGSRWDPSLAQARDDLLAGHVTAAVKSVEATRSSRSKLHSLTVPTLMLQGRHDFLFDIDQALTAYKLLAGPKRLYLGDLGHPPAANPAAEQPTYLGEAVAWFAHYLAGVGTVHGGVELAHDPWDGSTTSFKGSPGTRHKSVNLPGSKRIASNGSVRRSARLTGGPFETFGHSFVSVRYSRRKSGSWTEMRAMVAVKGSSAPITVGAAHLGKRRSGVLKIPLFDEAVLLPRGKKLVVSVGSTSADGVYLPLFGGPGAPPTIKIGRITLNLSLLKKTVSR